MIGLVYAAIKQHVKKPYHIEFILRKFFFSIFFLMLLLSTEASARLLVSATVPAQAWLVEQVAGEHVDILTMLPEGHVPETAQPGTRNLSRFQHADIRFIVGHPSLYFETRYIKPFREQTGKREGDRAVWVSMFEIAQHLKPTEKLLATDPHLWTSPAIMMAAARRLADLFSNLQPENTMQFRNNLFKLETEMRLLDNQIRTVIKNRKTAELLVYHPAWGHFSHDFGLHQLAIEDEGKAPGPGALSRLYAELDGKDIDFIISSPGHDQRITGMIAKQLHMTVVLINPMERDWMKMMHQMKSMLGKNINND